MDSKASRLVAKTLATAALIGSIAHYDGPYSGTGTEPRGESKPHKDWTGPKKKIHKKMAKESRRRNRK